MSFDLPSWILVLVSLKNQVTTEINLKSSQNAYEMYKFGDLCNLRKLEKIFRQNYVKKLIFGQTYMKFAVAMAMATMIDTQFPGTEHFRLLE